MTHDETTPIRLEDWRKYVGHPDQFAEIRTVEVLDGSGRGSRILEVRNAAGLECEILLDRGFDIFAVRYRGRPLHWVAPPGLQPPDASEPIGFGWLRGFQGGLLTTCGLEHIGNPVRRRVPEYLAPDARHTDFGEHGRISSSRAELEVRRINNDKEPQIELMAVVRQAALHAENITLRRRITIPVNSAQIHVEDVVSNDNWTSTPHALLYHVNFGYPLIDGPQTQVHVGQESFALQSLTSDAPERVWPLVENQEIDNTRLVQISNRHLGLTVALEYQSPAFTRCLAWQIPRLGINVFGLAPTTDAGLLGGRQSVNYRLSLRVVEDD
jgi:hypothetical protein